MKITRRQLNKILLKEIKSVLYETKIKPLPGSDFTDEEIENIDNLIFSGEEGYVNQAREFVDSLGGDPDYVDKIRDYDMESFSAMGHRHRAQSDEWDRQWEEYGEVDHELEDFEHDQMEEYENALDQKFGDEDRFDPYDVANPVYSKAYNTNAEGEYEYDPTNGFDFDGNSYR